MSALTLDCRGQRCPLPVIMLARRIGDVPPGGEVLVLADDPAARADIPAWCRLAGQDFRGEEPGPAYRVRRSSAASTSSAAPAP